MGLLHCIASTNFEKINATRFMKIYSLSLMILIVFFGESCNQQDNIIKKNLLINFQFIPDGGIKALHYPDFENPVNEQIVQTRQENYLIVDAYKLVGAGTYNGDCKIIHDTLELNYWLELQSKNQEQEALLIPAQFRYKIKYHKYNYTILKQSTTRYIGKSHN